MPRFRVRELAQERGLTSEELAIKSGVKISTLRNLWQNRTTDPNYSTMAAIARALNVPVEALIVPSKESEDMQKTELAGALSL